MLLWNLFGFDEYAFPVGTFLLDYFTVAWFKKSMFCVFNPVPVKQKSANKIDTKFI